MKKIILLLFLVISFSFAGYSSVGGIGYKDSVVIDSTADLAVYTHITSINASGATVTTATKNAFPKLKSVIILDSSTNTLNIGLNLRTDGETDGNIKVLYCKGYSLPLIVTTTISSNVTSVGGASTKNVIENASTTGITFTAAGQSKTLMYRKATDKFMVLDTQASTNIQTF